MAEAILLCQILTSHLCHEISGPISAIKNTMDFVNSSNEKIKNDAIILLEDASKELMNKIKFYSYVHSITQNNEQVPLEIIKNLCKGVAEKNNVKLDFVFQGNNFYFKAELSKAIMCLIITCYNNLLKGGKIQITNININKNFILSLRAIGTDLKTTNQKIKILTGNIDEKDIDIFNCNEYYIRILNDKLGYKLSINQSQDMIEYNYMI